MTSVERIMDTNFTVTAEQIARLEQALLSLRATADGHPEVIEAIATLQYNHILELRAELDVALGFGESVPDLVVALGGEGIGLGRAPFRLVSNTLERFYASVQNIVNFVATRDLPGRGRPTGELTRMADFQFVGVRPGSVRVMLNLQEPRSLLPEFDLEPMQVAVSHVLKIAQWASSQEDLSALRSATNDDRLTRVLLSQVQRIAPSASGQLDYIALTGHLVDSDQEVFLTRTSRKRLGDAFSELQAERNAVVTESGRLRRVDLDSGEFQLRSRPEDKPAMSCTIPRDIMAQAIGFLVEDAIVTLEGIQRFDGHGRPTNLDVTQIYATEP